MQTLNIATFPLPYATDEFLNSRVVYQIQPLFTGSPFLGKTYMVYATAGNCVDFCFFSRRHL